MRLRLSSQLILALCSIVGSVDLLDIRVGHLYDYDGVEGYNLGLNLTIDELTNTILRNSTITIFSAESCFEFQAPESTYELRTEHEIHALLGPICSRGMKPVAQLAVAWRMPIVSYRATASYLDNKDEFKTLARVSQTTEEFANAIGQLVVKMGWRHAAVVIADATPSWLRNFRPPIDQVFRENMVSVSSIAVPEEMTASVTVEMLDRIKVEARVVVLVLGRDLDSYVDVLLAAEERGMLTPDFVFIVACVDPSPKIPLPWTIPAERRRRIVKIFQRVLIVTPTNSDWQALGAQLERLENRTMATLNKKLTDFIWSFAQFPHWILGAMDALRLYGIAVNACLSEPECDWKDGIQLARYMRNIEFHGATGRVVMSDNAERLNDYTIQSLNEHSVLVTRFLLMVAKHYDHGESHVHRVLENRTPYNWRTADGFPPPDTPLCGFLNDSCEAESENLGLLLAVSAAAAVVLSIGAVLCIVRWRKRQFEEELKTMSWMLASEDVELVAAQEAAPMHDIRIVEEDELSLIEQLEPPQLHIVRANYRGERVIAKRAILTGELDLALKQRGDLLTLLAMKSMQHENVNPFIGLWMGDRSNLTFVWSYGQKGSLEDVIYNDDIQLDMVFKSSILKDIVSGLTYLHQSRLGCHGQLSAGNCIINSRWVLKLTDYGIDDLLRSLRLKNIPIHIDKPLNKLMNMAPELLRSYGYYGPEQWPTQEADIYSFGLILYQVLFREKPYEGNHNIGNSEIIMRLKHPGNAPLRPKPSISIEHVHKDLILLIDNCLAENPSQRPKLSQIDTTISKCTSATSENLVEHMIGMMERYTSNLEKMVDQRTRELLDERHRTDSLLERMLPQSVAENLKRGKSVLPDVFESVSVLMSRLVDFADICTVSTPIQVVQMMNHFYSLLDGIIEQYDAYKVETVGDSYLIVSGLPQTNGTNHVTIMVEMALDFQKAISGHKVEHLPTQKLRMRIGVHTGSVAAGVVGLTLPHYCLFGDTVNIAARLENTSKAMRIQISSETKMMLDKVAKDQYAITRRGMVDLKFWPINANLQ